MLRQNTLRNRSPIGFLCLLAIIAAFIPGVAFADPTLPTIPAGTFTVPAATGVAATDTANLKATLTAASANGGGTVIVPSGTYLCNNFSIPSNVNLQLSTTTSYIQNASPLTTLISIGSGHDIAITGSGSIDGRATTTKGSGNLITISNVTNLLVSGVTICNSSKFHLVPANITNMTIDGININDNYTKSMNGGAYLGNTDGIDYSGSHILIKNCNIDDGDDNIVAKPSSSHPCSDILITGCTIGHGHGISVGGQTDAGLDGLTVKNCTFNGTDNGLRLKAGPAILDGSTFGGLGGVVKNVSFSDITMTNVTYPIIINSWYISGDRYGYSQVSPSSLHTVTNPGETLHTVDQSNNSTAKVPFYDNIRFTNITATGNMGSNVAIIYGLDSQPPTGNPNGDPLRNIDNVSFNNVNLTGSYNADIYYASRLDTSGLKVNGSSININQTGNSSVLPSYTGYTIWQGGNTTAPGANHSPTDWNNAYNWTSDIVPTSAAGTKVAFGNQDASNSVVDMVISPKTVGSIYYSPDTSTTIQSSGGFSLILNNGSSASVIDVRGSHTISAPVSLISDVNIIDTGTLTLSGGISGSHAVNVLGNDLTVKSINVSTLTIGSGLTVTIQPITGGPQALNDNLQPVPEPSILALLGINFVGLLAYYWRRRASRCGK
jgi:polygalacturonase